MANKLIRVYKDNLVEEYKSILFLLLPLQVQVWELEKRLDAVWAEMVDEDSAFETDELRSLYEKMKELGAFIINAVYKDDYEC